MPHPRRCRRESQRHSGFRVAELFKVPHQNDVAVVVFELFDSREKPRFQFSADVRGSWCQFVIDKFPRQVECRTITILAGSERLFPIETATLRPAMLAVHVDDAVFGQVPQPQVKGQPGIGEVIAEPLIGFEEHILHDVAGIDTAGDGAIKPQPHHLPQRIAVPIEQLIHGQWIAATGARQQLLRLGRIGPDASGHRESVFQRIL